jgi:hypothetical protein
MALVVNAVNPDFMGDLVLAMLADPASAATAMMLTPESLRFWRESGFEKAAKGAGAAQFLRFLVDIQTQRGSLTIPTAEKAKAEAESLSHMSSASNYDPIAESQQRYLTSPDAPRTPYRNDGDYLVKNGFKTGKFVLSQADTGHWIIQSVDGHPTTAWLFVSEGFPPRKTVDLAASVRQLRDALDAAAGKPKAEAAGALAAAAGAAADLAFLRRIRGTEYKEARDLDDP